MEWTLSGAVLVLAAVLHLVLVAGWLALILSVIILGNWVEYVWLIFT